MEERRAERRRIADLEEREEANQSAFTSLLAQNQETLRQMADIAILTNNIGKEQLAISKYLVQYVIIIIISL